MAVYFAIGASRSLNTILDINSQLVLVGGHVLSHQGAPKEIDFLSIDTEGSELVILQSLALDQYRFNTIALEHNYVEPKRTQMRELLQKNQYVHIPIVASRWDDFYIHERVLHQMAVPVSASTFTF